MSRSGRTSRLAAALSLAGAFAVGIVPVAYAGGTTTVTPTKEAWYQSNPTCAQPTGCVTPGALPVPPPVEIPLSPYPSGTLHVGYAGGQETARTYLQLPLDRVTATVTGATLTVPLDVTEANGSTAPDTAKVQACLFNTEISAVEGSTAAPPRASCGAAVDLKYVATPAPHLEGDLARLGQGLLTSRGIVLLPNASKVEPTDAFRVVFSAHNRADAAKTPPATLTLTTDDDEDPPPPVGLPDADSPVLSGVAPAVGTGFATTPTVDSPVVLADSPAVAAPAAPVVPAPVAEIRAETVSVGYAYPLVWLLPLALLVLAPAATRALTKDLSPR